MPELYTHLQYNDPMTIIARSGTSSDPFINRTDSLPVINGLITLLELPSVTDKVLISGLTEIDQEVYENRPYLEPNEFLVHYGMGVIQFHELQEGKTHLCRYKGRGLIMYPASRIYAMVTRHPDVVITLQDYIDQIQDKINENQIALERIEQAIKDSKDQTELAKFATDNANTAADDANLAASKAMDAYATTRLVFKPPVEDMYKLVDTYPNPEVGWTVQTYKDGKRYRYNGNQWIEIDIFGSNLQPVNEFKDGLMSVAEHLKLKDIPLEVQDRVVVFCKESDVFAEILNVPAPFPFNGEIVDIRGFCGTHGDTETEIDIEKTRDLKNWTSILDKKIHFKANERFDDQTLAVKTKTVNAGDLFRLNVTKAGVNFQDMTIHLIIRT